MYSVQSTIFYMVTLVILYDCSSRMSNIKKYLCNLHCIFHIGFIRMCEISQSRPSEWNCTGIYFVTGTNVFGNSRFIELCIGVDLEWFIGHKIHWSQLFRSVYLACIYPSWKLTAWLPGTYVAKYSLIFCGNLISQERMWLIKSIRLHHENINHVSPVSLSTSGWTHVCVQMCACPSENEKMWVHPSAATILSTEGIGLSVFFLCVCVYVGVYS